MVLGRRSVRVPFLHPWGKKVYLILARELAPTSSLLLGKNYNAVSFTGTTNTNFLRQTFPTGPPQRPEKPSFQDFLLGWFCTIYFSNFQVAPEFTFKVTFGFLFRLLSRTRKLENFISREKCPAEIGSSASWWLLEWIELWGVVWCAHFRTRCHTFVRLLPSGMIFGI